MPMSFPLSFMLQHLQKLPPIAHDLRMGGAVATVFGGLMASLHPFGIMQPVTRATPKWDEIRVTVKVA